MVPDTCEPTCTVVTALMVPVACTTFCTSPFCTFSVKYCGAFADSSLKAVSPAMVASNTPMIVHLFLRNFMLTPESFSGSGESNPDMVGITVKSDRREVNICQRECGDYGRYKGRITDLYAGSTGHSQTAN